MNRRAGTPPEGAGPTRRGRRGPPGHYPHAMNDIRETFIETSEISHRLISRREVARSWDGPSALELFTIRGLAGHLLRGTGSVEAYLERPEPDEQPLSAAAYYAAAVDTQDITAPLHVAIRERGEGEAAQGHDALVERLQGLIERLRVRLEGEPAERRMRVHKDMVLTLDDYLVTRLIELTVHIDDLSVSVGVETPPIPPRALDLATSALVEVARERHGDLAFLRALTRRERDAVDAARVL